MENNRVSIIYLVSRV